MMNKKYLGIISLLLALVMALSACAPAAGGGNDEDTPVTAEPIFKNYLKIDAPADNPLSKVELISNDYGELRDSMGSLAIFYKESKDKLNNLTETYTLYSVAEGKSLLEIKNSYPDEYGWENDLGHETRPEKTIDYVEFGSFYRKNSNGEVEIAYVKVAWVTATPIDEEIVEKEDLADSYTVKKYYDFYDITGAFIATAGEIYEGKFGSLVRANDYYTCLSFGKTVAMFDNKEGKLVKTLNGDVDALPVLYDYETEKYNYLIVPNGITDDTQMMSRIAIEIYDKDGNLVREYFNTDYCFTVSALPLENGDVLIQHLALTESIDPDYEMDGKKLNADTFLLDVETGKVSELPDFGYIVAIGAEIMYADDIAAADIGLLATDNVRNVISGAINIETEEKCTIFVDNFGTVNYVFDAAINKEMGSKDEIITVLDSEHLLVEVSSGATDSAILAADGSLIAYVPDDAIVLANYILVGDSLYDFDMKKLREVNHGFMDNYEDDSIVLAGIFGDCVLYTAEKLIPATSDDPEVKLPYVVIFDVAANSANAFKNTVIYSEKGYGDTTDMGGYVILESYDEATEKTVYNVINGLGDSIFSYSGSTIDVTELEDALMIETDDGRAYLITEASVGYSDGEKNPFEDLDGNPDDDDDDDYDVEKE